jgi:hypothetical protein
MSKHQRAIMYAAGILVVVSYALFTIMPAHAHHNWAPGLKEKLLATTYVVEAVNFESGDTVTGTAFYIGEGRYLTAGHVVENQDVVTISGIVMDVVDYTNTEGDFDKPDWAILYLETPADRPYLELACDFKAVDFIEVVELGAPSGAALFASGILQANDTNTLYYTVDPALGPGASGAAVIDPITGRVIGIHVAGTLIGTAHVQMAWKIGLIEELCGG